MDEIDRAIVNRLQDGFPICDAPYAAAAAEIGIGEDELLRRLSRLLDDGILSRFGPLFNAEQLGGALCLAAMAVPPERFDAVAESVNAHPEVAHNYARDHALNMWFVLATERHVDIDATLTAIEAETGLKVYAMPKLEEFYIGLRLAV